MYFVVDRLPRENRSMVRPLYRPDSSRMTAGYNRQVVWSWAHTRFQYSKSYSDWPTYTSFGRVGYVG